MPHPKAGHVVTLVLPSESTTDARSTIFRVLQRPGDKDGRATIKSAAVVRFRRQPKTCEESSSNTTAATPQGERDRLGSSFAGTQGSWRISVDKPRQGMLHNEPETTTDPPTHPPTNTHAHTKPPPLIPLLICGEKHTRQIQNHGTTHVGKRPTLQTAKELDISCKVHNYCGYLCCSSSSSRPPSPLTTACVKPFLAPGTGACRKEQIRNRTCGKELGDFQYGWPREG